MNPYTLPLETWQRLLDEYKADPATQYEQRLLRENSGGSPCFRVDGTPFSVGIFYGSFRYNGVRYTVVDTTEPGAYLAFSPAFLAWVRKRKEPKLKPTPKGKQLTIPFGEQQQ